MRFLLLWILIPFTLFTQEFERTELPIDLNGPWEITMGPDHHLWLTEREGQVSRVNPDNGAYSIIYKADDYFKGASLENLGPPCNSKILVGTLGLALHPEFANPDSAYIYFVYSYNSGTNDSPATKFKVKRLKWDAANNTIIEDIDLITLIPTGYDHLGGRLIAIKQNQRSYLYLSIGDHGKSEMNDPDCYADQSLNPNNFTQDPTTKNGKIHRFNIDGTIPVDNPISNNSFFTRGHRNPQGLIYNPHLDLIYSVEHGDRTDDEVNILIKGMNYGWKNVRGYHHDDNISGENDFIQSYIPHPEIQNDSLVEAFYSWCSEVADGSDDNSNWCTVAPSDGTYYCSSAIPEWHNSLLVVTLKDGIGTDREVYQFKLLSDGSLAPSTVNNPNPKRFFGEDQDLNGRLRDITYSKDGKKIYLINSGGAPTSKITVYTLKEQKTNEECIEIYPNPSNSFIALKGTNTDEITNIQIISVEGKLIYETSQSDCQIDISTLSAGTYILRTTSNEGSCNSQFIKMAY